MNKDLDERLVPNGEYTDAMNIQVSTSEGSDVGTVQNILGNKKIIQVTQKLGKAINPEHHQKIKMIIKMILIGQLKALDLG